MFFGQQNMESRIWGVNIDANGYLLFAGDVVSNGQDIDFFDSSAASKSNSERNFVIYMDVAQYRLIWGREYYLTANPTSWYSY